jgi:hypothetical protein
MNREVSVSHNCHDAACKEVSALIQFAIQKLIECGVASFFEVGMYLGQWDKCVFDGSFSCRIHCRCIHTTKGLYETSSLIEHTSQLGLAHQVSSPTCSRKWTRKHFRLTWTEKKIMCVRVICSKSKKVWLYHQRGISYNCKTCHKYILRSSRFESSRQSMLARGHTVLTSRELMWCHACSWDVRSDLTLNSLWRRFTLLSLCLHHVISRGAVVGSRASAPLTFLLSHTFCEMCRVLFRHWY